jgi:hypothetical protein
MPTSLNALNIRRALKEHDDDKGRHWEVPTEFGSDGWRIQATNAGFPVAEVRCTVSEHEVTHPDDGYYIDLTHVEIIHASIVVLARMPSYEEMVLLHKAVFGKNRWSYQVFAPEASHVNIHEGALHLWGRLDGKPMMFDFSSATGTI